MLHHTLISALIAEIRILRERVSEAETGLYYRQETEARLSRRLQDAEYHCQEAERNASYRDREREEATYELEKARRYGDHYREERAIRRLKNI